MVNLFRTLILNELPEPQEVNEQFIDPAFSPVGLQQAEASVRSLLIQDHFPRSYRNFIATLLTRLVMQSPVAALLDAVDSRTTIDFSQNLVDSLQDTVTLVRQKNADSLFVTGKFNAHPESGQFLGSWGSSGGCQAKGFGVGQLALMKSSICFRGMSTLRSALQLVSFLTRRSLRTDLVLTLRACAAWLMS